MGSALHTVLSDFSRDGRTFMAPATALKIPAALSADVLQVKGLDGSDVATPNASPPAAFVGAPPCSSYFGQAASSAPPVYGAKLPPPIEPCGYTPQQLEAAYGFAPALRAGITGAGQTIAVIDAYSSPLIASDVSQWSADHGLPAPQLTVNDDAVQRNAIEIPPVLGPVVNNMLDVLPIGLPIIGTGDPQGWASEETLDVEAAHAMAPGAKLIFQGADSPADIDLNMAQNALVQADQATIISNSYGGTSDLTDPTADTIWQQAAAEGIGVYFAAGDNGDETGGTGSAAQRATDQGANSPYVTSVGGTTLGIWQNDMYGFETYWGVYSDSFANGAYASPLPGTFLYGGGGGTSEVYPEPAWQKSVVPPKFASYWSGNGAAVQGATVPGRVVPDVAIDADPQTGMTIGLVQDFDAYKNSAFGATSSDKDVYYAEYRIGGTSLASPLFAGVMALAAQAAGKRLGFANPSLYGAGAGAFHDIVPMPALPVAVLRTNYNNMTNGDGGTSQVLRTTGQTVSLTSAPGFDDSTGLGSPRGLAFLHALAPGSALVASLLARYGAG
jgi:subtilase family serine protease